LYNKRVDAEISYLNTHESEALQILVNTLEMDKLAKE
jgi:hypothetical protein